MVYTDYNELKKYEVLEGCFGETNDGCLFVVVALNIPNKDPITLNAPNKDLIMVYQDGGFDRLNSMWEQYMDDFEGDYIVKLVKNCYSFDNYGSNTCETIYRVPRAMTMDEIEAALGYPIILLEE